MTLREALSQRIPRVRMRQWNDAAYIRLPLLPGGYHGPWAFLFECDNRLAAILLFSDELMSEDDYEPFTGQAHPTEKERLALFVET